MIHHLRVIISHFRRIRLAGCWRKGTHVVGEKYEINMDQSLNLLAPWVGNMHKQVLKTASLRSCKRRLHLLGETRGWKWKPSNREGLGGTASDVT